jgi:Protein of Unknown function (DUF2784)
MQHSRMSRHLAADLVLILHGLFIVWVVLGGLAVLWRGWLAALHLPAVAWSVWISWSGHFCPLTPLEQSLRRAAGQAGYEGGFIEHYLTAAIYPAGLTSDAQIALGFAVLAVNAGLYALWWRRRRQAALRRAPP